MDLARASSYNQNNPTSIANNSVADSLAENQRLQSSKPPALQSLENIPRQTNNSNIIDVIAFLFRISNTEEALMIKLSLDKPGTNSQVS